MTPMTLMTMNHEGSLKAGAVLLSHDTGIPLEREE
jgi:hypothetical protein